MRELWIFSPEVLLRVFGCQAYHRALFIARALSHETDDECFTVLMKSAQELMRRGYDCFPEEVQNARIN